jgi:hypothetical protein
MACLDAHLYEIEYSTKNYTGLVTRDFRRKFRYIQPKLQFPMVSSFLNL